MALPSSSLVRRGVTLLELLIVLTLMGISAALVVPTFARREPKPEAANAALVASARRTALRRAEPLRVTLSTNGAWSVRAQRDGALIDSGHVRDPLLAADVFVDALGGCMPATAMGARSAPAAAFDPLTCAYGHAAVRP